MKLSSRKVIVAAFLFTVVICMSKGLIKAADDDLNVYRNPALSGFNRTWVYVGDDWDESISKNRIFADDLEDGDLTSQITRTGTVDTTKAGEYRLTYTVTDSDDHTTTMSTVVNVIEKNDTADRRVQRTLYTLGDASHLTDIGFNRGYYHDRQSLGIYLPAGAELQIRLANTEAFQEDLNIGFYNSDQESENKEVIPSDGEWVTLSNDYEADSVPFVVTPKNNPVQPVLEFQWTDQMEEIPYYRYGDDEDVFFERWEEAQTPFAIIEGSAATFLIPIKDMDSIVDSPYTDVPEYRFSSIDEMLEWYADFVKQYDAYAGLDFYADEPYNQNVRAKFFIKANEHGAGAAYYTTDHSAFNGDSLKDYLTRSWLALHEFGHGYEGAIAAQENAFVETTNNIMGHYFEKTYRPASQFGWLMGDSNEPTVEGRLAALEQKSLERKAETHSFNGIVAGGMHYQVSLLMFTNALDRLGPKETVSNMHESYRRYYYETKKMRGSSDAVVESFSESGYNMVPYFETYHIKPSQKLENEIYNKDYPVLYYLYDLIPDDTLAARVRTKLGLPGVYCLVDTDDLAYTGYKSEVEFQIQIDNLNQVLNKKIIIKNGKKIVKTVPITSNTIKTELPVGAYEVEIPAPNDAAYAYDNICLIASKGRAKQDITYRRVTGNALADDIKVTMHGMSDGLFAYVTIDSAAEKLTWHTLAMQPHYLYDDSEYAHVDIYSPLGELLYSQSVIGSETLEEYEKEIDFPIGARLVITHDEGNGRLRLTSTYFGDAVSGYVTKKGENAFVMTEYGLMQEDWEEEMQESVYLNCLNRYSKNTASDMNAAFLQDPDKFHQEKMVIQNAYQTLSEEKKAEYDKKWGIFTGKDSMPVYIKIRSTSLSGVADSEQGSGVDGPAAWALDGDETSIWHSNYSGKNEVDFSKDRNNNYTITLSENTNIGKLEYVPRQDSGNGRILSCELYYSETMNGDDFKRVSHPAVVWENNRNVKTLEFDAENAKRLRIHVTSAVAVNKDLISAAEFYLYEKKEIKINAADIYLSNLNHGAAESGAAPKKDRDGNGGEISLTVNGVEKSFQKGIGLMTGSSVIYDIDGRNFDIFTAYAGVESETVQGKTARFQIYGDDTLLYESEVLTGKDNAQMPYLNISGVKKLKIAVTGDEGICVSFADARFYLTKDYETLTLSVGETARLTANDSLNLAETGIIRWESDHEETAVVDEAGNITGMGIGDAVISASKEGWESPRTYQVHVVEKPAELPDDTEQPGTDKPATQQPEGLTKPTGISISQNQTTSMTLTWTPVNGAAGYEIYRAKKDSEDFLLAAVVNEASYTDQPLAAGTAYTYKIRAYKEGSSSEFSDNVWSTTKPSKTTIKKVKKSGKKASIKWKKNKQAQGYEIWMKQKGAFKKVKTVSAKKTSVKSKKLKKGRKYTFKIRAYRLDSENNKIYGAFSKTKKVKI